MEKTGKTIVFILGFVLFLNILILNAGFASANTLVAGTIYEGNPKNGISGASVVVYCGLDSLNTISLNDGAYAVVFDTDSCSNINVQCSYDSTKIIVKIDSSSNPSQDGAPTTSGTRSSGGGFYMCGNGKCDSGETASTCAEDCAVKLTYSDEDNENSGLIELGVSESEKDQNAITGAVIGESGKGKSYLIILIVVIALIVILLSARLIRLNRKK